MFGAASAPVTRLGDFRLDPMSTASVLLSMIAPAAPTTPQGSAAVDTSAFEGLLASMMGGDTMADGEGEAALSDEKSDSAVTTGVTPPAQTLPPAPQPVLLLTDADLYVDAPAVPASEDVAPAVEPDALGAATVTPTASTPLPVDKTPADKGVDAGPQVRPAVKTGTTDQPDVQPLAPTEPKPATAGPQTQPPVAPAVRTRFGHHQVGPGNDATLYPSSADAAGTGDAPAPQVQPLAPAVGADKAAESPVGRPQVQPPLPAPVAAVPAEAPAPVKDDADISAGPPSGLLKAMDPVDLTEVVTPPPPEAERKAAEAARSIETPALRALAERASRPVETNAAVDTAAPATPAGAAVTATPSAATTDASAAAPAVAAAVATVEATADADETAQDGPVDAAALEAAPSAQTAQASREALPSTLSRVAVEATAQIAAQIIKRLEGRSTRFEMALTPDDMGRIDVKLEIDAEGRLAARLAFDNPAAAADLKGRADELRRQLEQQGFHLAEDAFEFTQRDSGSSAFDRGQDTRQGQSRAFAAASRLNAEADVAQPARWTSLSLTPAGVDLKV